MSSLAFRSVTVFAVLLLCACSRGRQRHGGSDSPDTMRGVGCPSDIECPNAMRCLSYTTSDGRTLDACEDPCKHSSQCPAGLQCTRVADRPSKVCRGR